MINYNYCCLNENCDNKKNQLIQKEEKEERRPEYCIDCGEIMKLLGFVPAGGIGKFAGMTPTQKHQVLLKRSREHFAAGKDNIKDRKHALNQQFKTEAKDMIKGKR